MNESLITEAYQEVDYLREKMRTVDGDFDFESIPLLEKDEIVEDPLKLMAPCYLPLLYRGELVRNDTSGSTGKYMEVYWRKQDYIKSMYPLWFYRNYFYGIRTWDKMCRFYTISRIGTSEELERYTKTGLEFSKNDLSEERLLDIYHKMEKFQPVWLLLQPCIAELLCFVKIKYQLPDILSLRYIEMTGEELTEDLRDRIRDCFHCLVANQYGANEVNSIAYECPQGHLHCMEDNVYVEILDDKGTPVPEGVSGNIYVTTCHNYAMPFIRYGIGDKGSLEENTCTCGHQGRILKLRSGRRDDWVWMENGRKINPYVFIRAVEAVNAIYERSIFQFQVIQRAYRDFLIRLAVDDEEEPAEIRHCFVENIGDSELRNAQYEFSFYDKLFPEMNGKRKFFKSEIGG